MATLRAALAMVQLQIAAVPLTHARTQQLPFAYNITWNHTPQLCRWRQAYLYSCANGIAPSLATKAYDSVSTLRLLDLIALIKYSLEDIFPFLVGTNYLHDIHCSWTRNIRKCRSNQLFLYIQYQVLVVHHAMCNGNFGVNLEMALRRHDIITCVAP